MKQPRTIQDLGLILRVDKNPCTVRPQTPGNYSHIMSKIIDSISNAIKDGITLDVLTFQGTVTFTNLPTWDDIEKAATPAAGGTASVSLKMATRVKIDSDTSMFISDPLPDQKIMDAHNAALKAALDSRNAIVDTIKDLIKTAVGK